MRFALRVRIRPDPSSSISHSIRALSAEWEVTWIMMHVWTCVTVFSDQEHLSNASNLKAVVVYRIASRILAKPSKLIGILTVVPERAAQCDLLFLFKSLRVPKLLSNADALKFFPPAVSKSDLFYCRIPSLFVCLFVCGRVLCELGWSQF